MTKLFKCVLTSSIRDLPDKTEYLRCKSKKILDTMFKQCFGFQQSSYFGYYMVTINEMKLSDFPTVMTVKVKCST